MDRVDKKKKRSESVPFAGAYPTES
jgi:hypothetical protein